MSHSPRPPFAGTSGPAHPRLVLVGEAWGENEEGCHKPFSGESGKELWRMLGEAMPEVEPELHRAICDQHKYGQAWVREREPWLSAAGIAMTNVLAFRPQDNKLENICGKKAEVGAYAGMHPPLSKGKYLRDEYLSELDRLATELAAWRPNLVVALGNSACWALLQATNIGSIRGAVTQTQACAHDSSQVSIGCQIRGSDGAPLVFKCLPTYHPAGVLRNWSWRPIVVADLMKAHRESQFPEIRRPARTILVDPTLEEMLAWEQETYRLRPEKLGADIETEAGQITKISFASSPSNALVIPFWDRRKPGYSYWPDQQSERKAWDCTERLLQYDCTKVGQNFIYDLQYLTRCGIRPTRCTEDTMLLHHSMFPELQKGLGFLGSVYTGETSWKLMRKRKADSEKKDE